MSKLDAALAAQKKTALRVLRARLEDAEIRSRAAERQMERLSDRMTKLVAENSAIQAQAQAIADERKMLTAEVEALTA